MGRQSVQTFPSHLELENMPVVTGDDSHQPLIVDGEDEDVNNSATQPDITGEQANRLIWLLTLSAGLSGLLFGYEYIPSDPIDKIPMTDAI